MSKSIYWVILSVVLAFALTGALCWAEEPSMEEMLKKDQMLRTNQGLVVVPSDEALGLVATLGEFRVTYTPTSPNGSGEFSVLQGTIPYQEGTVTITTDEQGEILTIQSKLTQLNSGETADISSTTSRVDDCHVSMITEARFSSSSETTRVEMLADTCTGSVQPLSSLRNPLPPEVKIDFQILRALVRLIHSEFAATFSLSMSSAPSPEQNGEPDPACVFICATCQSAETCCFALPSPFNLPCCVEANIICPVCLVCSLQ
jgi:hypothetical protein